MVMGTPVGRGMEIWEITASTAADTPISVRLLVEMARSFDGFIRFGPFYVLVWGNYSIRKI
jgi:hypothetical protein